MLNLPKNKIQTVGGLIDPENLGFTLTHEHLYHKASTKTFNPKKSDFKFSEYANKEIKLENKWYLDYHPYSNENNLKYNTEELKNTIIEEMLFYKSNGGGAVVDNTTFGKDLNFFADLQKKTNVNIIAGAGYYIANAFDELTWNLKVEEIYNNMANDFIQNDIKCGILGELGTTYPLKEFEKKVIMAAGELCESNKNLPVAIHPDRKKKSPFESLRVFLESGGNVDKVVMCHLERTLIKDEDLLEFAKLGTFCQFDLFGAEISYYELCEDVDMPNDSQRAHYINVLKENGYLDKIMISHDIHTKHRLMKYGGHGFSHILINAIPLLKCRGLSENQIKIISNENPKTWLTY